MGGECPDVSALYHSRKTAALSVGANRDGVRGGEAGGTERVGVDREATAVAGDFSGGAANFESRGSDEAELVIDRIDADCDGELLIAVLGSLRALQPYREREYVPRNGQRKIDD